MGALAKAMGPQSQGGQAQGPVQGIENLPTNFGGSKPMTIMDKLEAQGKQSQDLLFQQGFDLNSSIRRRR